MTEPLTFALFADAIPADPEIRQSMVHHNVAVMFANAVRTRGHRLLVYADAATTISVIAASAQYHRPVSIETERRGVVPYLSVFAPLDRQSFLNAESRGIVSRDEKQGQQASELWQVLGEWGGGLVGDVHLEKSQFRFLEDDPMAVFKDRRPALFVVLGRTERLLPAIERVSDYVNELRIPVFIDGDGKAEDMLRGERRSADSILSKQQATYRWHPPSVEGRERPKLSEETLIEINEAQREAQLYIALESLLEGIGGNDEMLATEQ